MAVCNQQQWQGTKRPQNRRLVIESDTRKEDYDSKGSEINPFVFCQLTLGRI